MATATDPASLALSPRPARVPAPKLPVIQPGVMLVTPNEHRCDTFDLVPGTTFFECQHRHVLRRANVGEAYRRAGGQR